jgi:hypothetical protein
MSLSETQQIYEILTQIDAILKGINLATEKLEQKAPAVQRSTNEFRQLERLALRYLVLARRLGLPPEIDNAVTKISQMIVTIEMARKSLMLLNASMYTNPVTGAIAVAGLALATLSASDFMMGIGE